MLRSNDFKSRSGDDMTTSRNSSQYSSSRMPPIKTPVSLMNRVSPRLPLYMPRQYNGALIHMLDRPYEMQSLDDQLRVITAVCKKLNSDVESLDAQLGEKSFIITRLEQGLNDAVSNNSMFSKDAQFRFTRHESALGKLEGDNMNMMSMMKDLQSQLMETQRVMQARMSDIDMKLNDLSSKVDSILSEQNLIIRNVEGDTVKQLQLLDTKTRSMLDDIKHQVNQLKGNNEADLSRMETRIMMRIEDGLRNNDKLMGLDRRIEDLTVSTNKRIISFEEEFSRELHRVSNLTDRLEMKLTRGGMNDTEKLRREMKLGFENLQDSIVTLQRVVDGKIKLSEDRLEKELEKIRKMVTLM